MEEVKLPVKSTTNVARLSDSICRFLADDKLPALSAMGPDSVNQAVKALCRARSSMARRGYNLTWYAYFEDQTGKRDGINVSPIVMRVILRREE